MKFAVFGLTVSSSWGNGHATLWRGLTRSLIRRGHEVVFFERDVPYYAAHRDLDEIPGGTLVLYSDWESVRARAVEELRDAEVGMVTSYCADALDAGRLIFDAGVEASVFYDLDTPITLDAVRAGEQVAYLGEGGLRDFDLVLSYTGGAALGELRDRLGARNVAPLYGHVDPEVHRPVPPHPDFTADLSYLGTYAADRQAALESLFIEPARRLPDHRFMMGGAQYPHEFPWAPNIFFRRHVAPDLHPVFYCSSRMTLNVTRRAMAEMGYCPSGRLFEAAACGTALISDSWDGLSAFFTPGEEILVANDTDSAVAALSRSDAEVARIARAARERTLEEHTSDRRALELEEILAGIGRGDGATASALVEV
jgi:spore maturation protein CgeB